MIFDGTRQRQDWWAYPTKGVTQDNMTGNKTAIQAWPALARVVLKYGDWPDIQACARTYPSISHPARQDFNHRFYPSMRRIENQISYVVEGKYLRLQQIK